MKLQKNERAENLFGFGAFSTMKHHFKQHITAMMNQEVTMKMKKKVILGGAIVLASVVSGCASTETVVKHETTVKHEMDHQSMCTTFASQKDYDNALAECKAAVAQDPTAKAYTSLGVVYMQLGKPNLALSALNKAYRKQPKDPIVNYNLAAAYSVADKTDVSLEYVDRALANGFNNFDALAEDPDLQNVRSEPEYRRVLEKHHVFIH